MQGTLQAAGWWPANQTCCLLQTFSSPEALCGLDVWQHVPVDAVTNVCQNCGLAKSAHKLHMIQYNNQRTLKCNAAVSENSFFLRPLLRDRVGLKDATIDSIKVVLTFLFQTADWASDVWVMVEVGGEGEARWMVAFFVAFFVGNVLVARLIYHTLKEDESWVRNTKVAAAVFGLVHVPIFIEYWTRKTGSSRVEPIQTRAEPFQTGGTEVRVEPIQPRVEPFQTETALHETSPFPKPSAVEGAARSPEDLAKMERAKRSTKVSACKQLEALFESAPQLLLQLSHVWIQQFLFSESPGMIEIVSVALSLLSIGAALTEATNQTWKTVLKEKNTMGQVAIRLWHAADLAVHAASYAIFVAGKPTVLCLQNGLLTPGLCNFLARGLRCLLCVQNGLLTPGLCSFPRVDCDPCAREGLPPVCAVPHIWSPCERNGERQQDPLRSWQHGGDISFAFWGQVLPHSRGLELGAHASDLLVPRVCDPAQPVRVAVRNSSMSCLMCAGHSPRLRGFF